MTRKGGKGVHPLMGQLEVPGGTKRTGGLNIWLLKQLLGLTSPIILQ